MFLHICMFLSIFGMVVECSGLSSCLKAKKLDVSLQCSLNMLEGDTG